MSRIKSIFGALLLAAVAGFVPQAHAQTFKVILAGSSALWQTLALGAYNDGTCALTLTGCTGATSHWTSASNAVNLTDTRSTPINNDPGTAWIVWDSAATPNVWVFVKVDSVVGDRCQFAQPHCNVNATAAVLAAAGSGKISAALWGADTNLPASIQAALTAGASGTSTQVVTAAATDIRPEDAAWAVCRANSKLGASTKGGALSDGLDGLGYGLGGASANAPGVCPAFGAAASNLVGSPVVSAVTNLEGTAGAPAQANLLAFNILGTDPFNKTKIPAFVVTAVGAAPIVFITERDKGPLANVTNATELQLQQVFSGANCNGNAFDGGAVGGINVFLREPTSGTMNTTEATVFRRPTIYPTTPGVLGVSQETGVNPANANNNPLALSCGSGKRWRAVGSGEEVAGVAQSGTANFGGKDGIGYTFFSYGNVNTGGIPNNANYGYLQLNGVDPIFASYNTPIDPGQPGNGKLPGPGPNNSVCGGNFPCPEASIWSNGFSFPNLRNGTYRAWSLLRVVANSGINSTNVVALAKTSNKFVVTSVPDYVPALAVAGTTDLGLKLVRSHYVQRDGAGTSVEKVGNATNVPENGGDMGGAILPTTTGVTTEKQVCLVQNATADSLGPVARPGNAPPACN